MPGIGERFYRPWTGLWTFPKREPSHKWLGYFQTHFISMQGEFNAKAQSRQDATGFNRR